MEHELFTLFIRSGARQERSSVLCAQLVAQQSPDVCVSATGGIFLKSSNYPLLSSFLVKKRKKKEEEGEEEEEWEQKKKITKKKKKKKKKKMTMEGRIRPKKDEKEGEEGRRG